jgi:hypothetical protein
MLLALAAGSLVLTKKRAPITARRNDERVTPLNGRELDNLAETRLPAALT